MTKPLTFGLFQTMGPLGAWRLPDNTGVNFLTLDYWMDLAKRSEAAGADFLFIADDFGYPLIDGTVSPTAIEHALLFPRADPATIMSALSTVTEHLGLVVTMSTSAERPVPLARRFASLDHYSSGRIGWNVVTGAGQNASARLFGEPMRPHDQRYAAAEDHLKLAMTLWEGSWEADALKVDREAGVYADSAKVHEIHYEGPFYRADGIFSVPPSPQRTPVLFQAGASASGRDLAARYAEGVFLAAEPDAVRDQIADIRARAVAAGREPDAIKFLVAGTFIVAPTHDEAVALREKVTAFFTLEDAAVQYAFFTGLDLTKMDPSKPLATTDSETGRTNIERFTGSDGAAAPTVGEILEEFRVNGVMGNPFVGSPAEVVDQTVALMEHTGADGLLVQPGPTGDSASFFDLVVPELRRRGLIAPVVAPGEPARTFRERLFPEGTAHLPATHPGYSLRAGR
ncbi:NtaA/DmoA family FMN-dependent monooxygenase [Frondihabitans australicus]|uniref:FMN-dependent oxidoreductase (Nitrilotriacetate monooxygenase family) n=1 Tax=Frondihabitans australicus TaxID=386892 RepID=A0A495IBZ8_9MICO|nr:NtaA/DmoA family FMN-dependent monooxygenase [Frondihabitans australicus]RKR73533.1 FMN-dependent oxidoreductase (nitrilotriacetate monooxygenase family) [Frondihabitans australicus]